MVAVFGCSGSEIIVCLRIGLSSACYLDLTRSLICNRALCVCLFDVLAAAIVVALQSPHAELSVGVTKYGLWVTKNLAARNTVNRAQLGELGACPGAYWACG